MVYFTVSYEIIVEPYAFCEGGVDLYGTEASGRRVQVL